MNYSDLKSELDTGGVVLIDGATGTEIERRNVRACQFGSGFLLVLTPTAL